MEQPSATFLSEPSASTMGGELRGERSQCVAAPRPVAKTEMPINGDSHVTGLEPATAWHNGPERTCSEG